MLVVGDQKNASYKGITGGDQWIDGFQILVEGKKNRRKGKGELGWKYGTL